MKKQLLLLFTLLAVEFSNAQAPVIQWKKCYGGIGDEIANDVQQTFDGGYIVAGSAAYNDGDVTGNHQSGSSDVWIVKLSATGILQWQKCYGGTGQDKAYSIRQTIDSGYIVCGSTTSVDGDVTGFMPVPNSPYWGAYWILKISKTGVVQWQKTMQGTGNSFAEAYTIIQTRDTGYVVAGYVYNGNTGAFANGSIIKLSPSGAVQWESYGEIDYGVQQTKDGGYIVAGSAGGFYFILRKIDGAGIVQWQRLFGSFNSSNHGANSVVQTADGGYIAVGYNDVADTAIHDNHGKNDVWVIRTDSLGNLLWSKSYGGRRGDQGNSIKATADGGFIIAALTDSWDGDVQNVNPALIDTFGAINHTNIWIFKIDSVGAIQWQKTMGGNNQDLTGSMQQTADSGYILAGSVVSNINTSNGDINNTGFHWSPTNPNGTGHDFFVVKFAREAIVLPVSLTNFTGKVINKNAQLSWTTLSEINNKYFEVQRSADGTHFTTIGTVQGNSTTSLPHSYSFTDINFMQQVKAWYRLKQVDFDGNFTCSKIVYLQLTGETFPISINPNPASNSFTLSIPSNLSNVQVSVYNSKGALIKQQICNGGSTIFNTANWPAGEYLIKLITKNGNTIVKEIVVGR